MVALDHKVYVAQVGQREMLYVFPLHSVIPVCLIHKICQGAVGEAGADGEQGKQGPRVSCCHCGCAVASCVF